MRQLAPSVTVLVLMIASTASAQEADAIDAPPQVPPEAVAPTPIPNHVLPPVEEPTPEPEATASDLPAAPPEWSMEAVPPPDEITNVQVEEEVVGVGARLLLSVQTNAVVGELLEESGGISFSRATLTGVPDALVGVRFDRWTMGIGMTWSQISQNNPQMNPCTGGEEDFADTRTLFGLLPSVRFDVLTTDDGRGRMDAGLTVPILLSTRSREVATFECPGSGRDVDDTLDGVYGVNVHFGGRYHLWDPLTLGLEVGLSYLVFDQDDNPDTPLDEPSTSTLTVYSGINLSLELPI